MKSCNVFVVLLVSITLVSRIEAADDAAPKMPVGLLSIDGLKEYSKANSIKSVEALMDRLPNVLVSNYVLMEDSRSRQKPSTVDKPRIIMFLPDGSFFVGIATNEKSAGYNDVEMLERTADGKWKLGALRLDTRSGVHGEIHMAGAQLKESRGCIGCHGSNSRPIWGRYPTWPGAFANGAGHDLTSDQAKALNGMLASGGLVTNARVQKLNWKKRSMWVQGENFDLPERKRGLLNEAMNDAVGTAHFANLYQQIQKSNLAKLLMMTVLLESREFDSISGIQNARTKLATFVDTKWEASAHNFPRATLVDKGLILAGLDPYDDLYLSNGLHELTNPESGESQTQFEWNFIAIYSGDLIRVLFLDDLLREHPELGIGKAMVETDFEYSSRYDSLFEYFRTNMRYMYELSLTEKTSHLKANDAPTVGLRSTHLLTEKLLKKISPALIAFADELIQNAP